MRLQRETHCLIKVWFSGVFAKRHQRISIKTIRIISQKLSNLTTISQLNTCNAVTLESVTIVTHNCWLKIRHVTHYYCDVYEKEENLTIKRKKKFPNSLLNKYKNKKHQQQKTTTTTTNPRKLQTRAKIW